MRYAKRATSGSLIGAILDGALYATGRLPFDRAAFDATITRKGRIVQTSSIGHYHMMYAIASQRGMRRGSLRFQVEHQRIDLWLENAEQRAAEKPALALEIARLQRLVKGYGETHTRGWGNFQRIMAQLPRLHDMRDGADRLPAMQAAALAEDSKAMLRDLLEPVT